MLDKAESGEVSGDLGVGEVVMGERTEEEEAVGEETGGRGGLDEDSIAVNRRDRNFAARSAFSLLRDHGVREEVVEVDWMSPEGVGSIESDIISQKKSLAANRTEN